MTQLSIDQASAQLPALLGALSPGEEILLTEGGKPIAKVTPFGSGEVPAERRLGSAKGILTIVSEDDEHLDDFAEYM